MRVVEPPEPRQSRLLDWEEAIVEGRRSYPIGTEFCKQKMLNPIHVTFRPTMFDQAHCSSNMSGDTALSSAFNTLLELAWAE